MAMGLSVGINVAIAKYIGAKDGKKVSDVTHTAIAVSVIIGVLVGAFGFIFSKLFLKWMLCPEDIIDLATLYLRIYFLGAPLNLIYNFGAAALRAKGHTHKPLTYLFVSGVANVLLNALLVLVFNMHVDGVAIATVASQAIAAALVLRELFTTDGYCRIYLNKLKVDMSSFAEILKIGIPAGVQNSLFSISNVIIQSTINTFGSAVIAGNGNAQNFEGFINIAIDSIYQASISFIGQNYGADKKENINKIMKLTFILVTIVSLAITAICVPFRKFFLSIYNADEDIIAVGQLRIFIHGIPYFVFGWMQIFVSDMRGLGYGTLPVIISVIGVCVLRLVWIFFVFPLEPTIECVYWSYPLSWAATAVAQFIALMIVKPRAYEKMHAEHLARQAAIDQTQN